MGMRGSPSQFREIRRRVVMIGRVAIEAAPDCAREAGEATKETLRAGQDAFGSTLPPTQDGRPALTMLADKVTATATGGGFEVRVGGSGGFHQGGAGHTRIIRKVVPGEGEDIPLAWTERFAKVHRARFERAKRGG